MSGAATSIEIADTMAVMIDDATLAEPVAALVQYVVAYDLKDMATLRVSIVPAAVRESMHARGMTKTEIDIDLAVQKFVADQAAANALMLLTDEIVALFRFVDLNDDTAKNTATVRKFIYDPDGFEKRKLFTSLCTLTFTLTD